MNYIPFMKAYSRRMPYANLLAIDLEGTLLDGEMMEAIGAKLSGVYTELNGQRVTMKEYMDTITQMGMRGEMRFEDSFRARIEKAFSLVSPEDMKRLVCSVPFSAGVKDTLPKLREKYDIAVVSGGLAALIEHCLESKGIVVDYIAASSVIADNGKIQIYPLADKSVPIAQLVKDHGYRYVVAIGDGANDACMKSVADKFVWFCPKPCLAKDGDLVIEDFRELPGIIL